MSLHKNDSEDESWMSFSDLMSGLLIVFIIICVSHFAKYSKLQDENERLRKIINIPETEASGQGIAVRTREYEELLYEALMKEFEKNLHDWHAAFDRKTLTLTFTEPEVLFQKGSSDILPTFKEILQDFFPRYINILMSDTFRENIEEIRIEGHTSSEWKEDIDEDTAYFGNMELSQNRARAVLRECYNTIDTSMRKDFVKKNVTANGLSSSKIKIDVWGNEDKEKSRRVDIRIRVKEKKKIIKIYGNLQNGV